MNQHEAGEFRLCSGCGEWAIWTPQHCRGPVYCCEACERGLGCSCAEGQDERPRLASIRRSRRQGGHHDPSESVCA
jgi:hypothetical protein